MEIHRDFVQAANIDRFIGILNRADTVSPRHETVCRLLLEEEKKYAYHAQRLDLIEIHIDAGERRISHQRRLIERLRSQGHDASEAVNLLRTFTETLRLLYIFRAQIEKQ